jgi:hypothetical protein
MIRKASRPKPRWVRLVATITLSAVATEAIASWSGSRVTAAEGMKVRFKIGETEITGILTDNATSRDLFARLPLALTLEDYGDIEKIGYLPKKLSTNGAPAGSAPSAGDIAYYAPWGNLAFFRKSFRHSNGLVSVGRIESGLEALNLTGRVDVVIERLGK